MEVADICGPFAGKRRTHCWSGFKPGATSERPEEGYLHLPATGRTSGGDRAALYVHSAWEAAKVIDTRTHSAILFLTACSLTKSRGGEPHYDENDAIATGVGADLRGRLLARREEVRGLIKGNRDLRWQGVSLADAGV